MHGLAGALHGLFILLFYVVVNIGVGLHTDEASAKLIKLILKSHADHPNVAGHSRILYSFKTPIISHTTTDQVKLGIPSALPNITLESIG